MKTKASAKTLRMVQLAILAAITLIFAFTPLGYLKVGIIEITFMVIPVTVGAMVLGPAAGAILGAIFGITSFIQCFGMSAFGVFLLGLNPVLTCVTCIIPRILCGWLSGLIFRAVHRVDRTRLVSYFVGGLSTALLNTIFFMLSLILFFWKNPMFISKMNEWGIATDNLWLFLIAFVGLNGLVEAIVNSVVGAAIAKAVRHFLHMDPRPEAAAASTETA